MKQYMYHVSSLHKHLDICVVIYILRANLGGKLGTGHYLHFTNNKHAQCNTDTSVRLGLMT